MPPSGDIISFSPCLAFFSSIRPVITSQTSILSSAKPRMTLLSLLERLRCSSLLIVVIFQNLATTQYPIFWPSYHVRQQVSDHDPRNWDILSALGCCPTCLQDVQLWDSIHVQDIERHIPTWYHLKKLPVCYFRHYQWTDCWSCALWIVAPDTGRGPGVSTGIWTGCSLYMCQCQFGRTQTSVPFSTVFLRIRLLLRPNSDFPVVFLLYICSHFTPHQSCTMNVNWWNDGLKASSYSTVSCPYRFLRR